MPGSDAQNGDIYQAYPRVTTDPANRVDRAARRRVSQRTVGPGGRKGRGQVQHRCPPHEGDIYSRDPEMRSG